MMHTLPKSLKTFIMGLPFASHIINIQTGKYLFSNKEYAKHQGFKQPVELLKMTVDDLFRKRQKIIEELTGSPYLEAEYKIRIHYANQYVHEENKSIHLTAHYLSPDGFICLRKFTKLPIFQDNEAVSSLLTYENDITDRLSLIELYRLYRNHYPKNGTKAISSFLCYLTLIPYFHVLPTQQELMTLLQMTINDASKYVAAQLGIHMRTVDGYKQRLRSKLHDGSLDKLLIVLRLYTSGCGKCIL